MGYRALLKKYLSAVEAETGSLHLERLSEQAEFRFTARDLGELRALAAELCRERPAVACSGLPRKGGRRHEPANRQDSC